MDPGENFGAQEAIYCSILYRTAGLEQALGFLLGQLKQWMDIERINLLCSSRDLEVFLPVGDTGPIDYGIVRRRAGEAPPLLLPEKMAEPCIISDLSTQRHFLERIIPNENVPLFHYASLLRLPLFATPEYFFSLHLFSRAKNAFSESFFNPLQRFIEPLKEVLRENFDAAPILPASPERSAAAELLQCCPDLAETNRAIAYVAPTMTNVLINGETGCGKELAADAVHELSIRANGPLIKINCGALPETLLDSELFGHEKGAYTGAFATRKGYFEMASDGTLFLDEIGEMPLIAQSRLLRVLDDGAFFRVGGTKPVRSNTRIIAATNRNLAMLVREGKFRKDLYYRLAAYPINLPPLRARPRDIPILTRYFFETGMEKHGIYLMPMIPAKEEQKLMNYAWPGNVRELKFVIERCLIELRAAKKSARPVFRLPENLEPVQDILADDWPPLEELKCRYIQRVLQKTGGKQSGPGGAASILGIHYSSLARHLASISKNKA